MFGSEAPFGDFKQADIGRSTMKICGCLAQQVHHAVFGRSTQGLKEKDLSSYVFASILALTNTTCSALDLCLNRYKSLLRRII